MGIDCGGTTTKAALYTADGHEIAVESVKTAVLVPKPSYAERDMHSMQTEIFGLISKLIVKSEIQPETIKGIACCGHGKGLYLWGKNGKPVRHGILSADNRAADFVVQWRNNGTERRAFEYSCQHVMSCQPVALLAWLKENEPETIANTKWVFECKDYVRFLLTGKAAAEISDYSGANLINLHTHQYDLDLLSCFGIDDIYDKLPPLCKSTDLCGSITKEVAEQTGLCEGTPVAGGMFDINACAIASNCICEDKICVIAGTWSINEYIRTTPITDKSVLMNSIFCDSEHYLIEESSPTSASNNEWFIHTLLPELAEKQKTDGKSIYDFCNQMVEHVPIHEFCPIFLPFLFASNVNVNAKSCFIGLTSYHSRAHLMRSVYEGIAYSHKYHIDKLLNSRSKKPSGIQLAGGVACSSVWSQMFADILQLPVTTIDVNETGALGCAIAAAVATGTYASFEDAIKAMVKTKATYTPRSENSRYYLERYEIYRKVIDALDPVWDSICKLM